MLGRQGWRFGCDAFQFFAQRVQFGLQILFAILGLSSGRDALQFGVHLLQFKRKLLLFLLVLAAEMAVLLVFPLLLFWPLRRIVRFATVIAADCQLIGRGFGLR